MKKGTHGKGEQKFSELSYAGQAKSINSQILSVERALNAHFERGEKEGKDINDTKEKYMLQLKRLIKGIE
tara:strand:+ start:540 stop:749 length:210 start_codon:yes stop_codon:yes gene_type:complete